jgi:hypothetical protein
VYELKLLGMFGAALRLAGWNVQALVPDARATWSARYLAVLGITDLLHFDRFELSDSDVAAARRTVSGLMAGDLGFSTVRNWSIDGYWLGPQVLSSLSRAAHEGAPDPSTPENRSRIAALLEEILLRGARARRVLRDAAPAAAVTIEANYSLFGPVVDAAIAAGADVIQTIQPWRDDTVILQRVTKASRRMHPCSITAESFRSIAGREWTDAEEARLGDLFQGRYDGRWVLQSRNQIADRTTSRDELLGELQLDPARKTAVVFSHVLWDANLFYGEDLYADYAEWFVETVRVACMNRKVNWVIKLHPANVWKRARDGAGGEYTEFLLIRERIGELPPHVRIIPADYRISARALFDLCDFGVTVRGTVGTELPCFGVPTFTAGTGRYSGMGFTFDSDTREEYESKLRSLPNVAAMTGEQIRAAKRYALAAFESRHWSLRSFRAEFRKDFSRDHPLGSNLSPVARSLEEVGRNGDFRRFVDWVRSDSIDYLEGV